MADHGAIARGYESFPHIARLSTRWPVVISAVVAAAYDSGRDPRVQTACRSWPLIYRGLRVIGVGDSSSDRLYLGGRDNTDGEPDAPCIRILMGGSLRFRCPVDSGTRRISVKARESSLLPERPRLVVHANNEIGLNSDLTAQAPPGTDWVTIGPVIFTASQKGGVVVELISYRSTTEGDCQWDNLVIV